MKTVYNRVLCLIFVLLLALSSFGCAKSESDHLENTIDSMLDTNTSAAETAASTEATPVPPAATPKNYGGATFTVVLSDGNEDCDIFFDEGSESEIDRQIKTRNEAVESTLGVKITQQTEQNVAEYIKSLTQAEQSPDLVYASGNGGMSELMLYGCLSSLSDYREHNTTASGVSVSVVQQLSVYGQIYMLTGAPIRSSLESATVVAYDTNALSSLGYEDGYLCKLVTAGDWTLDKMTSIAKQASSQNINNTSYRAVSGNDEALYGLWKGLGARTVEKTAGDVPTVSVYSPKNVYLFEQVNNFELSVGGIPDTNDSLFYIGTVSDTKAA